MMNQLHWKGGVYYYTILIESLILAVMCATSIFWLYSGEIEANIISLKYMINITLGISILFIPLESVAFHFYQNHNPQCALSFQRNHIRIIFPKLTHIFAFLFIVHFGVFKLVQGKFQLKQGSDIYMRYIRPGSLITFMSLIGMEVVNLTVVNCKSK